MKKKLSWFDFVFFAVLVVLFFCSIGGRSGGLSAQELLTNPAASSCNAKFNPQNYSICRQNGEQQQQLFPSWCSLENPFTIPFTISENINFETNQYVCSRQTPDFDSIDDDCVSLLSIDSFETTYFNSTERYLILGFQNGDTLIINFESDELGSI